MSASTEKGIESSHGIPTSTKLNNIGTNTLSPLGFNTLPFSFPPSNTNTPRESSIPTITSPQYNPLNLEFFDVLDDDFEIPFDDETDLTLCIDKVYVTNLMEQYPESSASVLNHVYDEDEVLQNKPPLDKNNVLDVLDRNCAFKNRNAIFSYSPHSKYKTQKFMTISRVLTQHIIPNKVHPSIENVYSFINKSTAIAHRCCNVVYFNDNSSVIYNYDLYDKQSGELLYCIADKKWSKKNNQYHYKMRDELYTKQDIQIESIYLPQSSRYSYDKILSEKAAIERKLTTSIMDVMEKVKWNRINVYNDALSDHKQYRSQYNTKRLTFYIKTHAFHDIIHEYLCRVPQITLIPIVMFVVDEHCCDFRVEYVQIINICDNINIGISYVYDSYDNQIKVTGIHVNKSRIMEQHQLISPHDDCHCLDAFETRINDIRIGNPDDDRNRFKDIKRRMQSKHNTIKQLQTQIQKLETKLKDAQKAAQNINMNPNYNQYNASIYPFYINLPAPQPVLIATVPSHFSILSVPGVNTCILPHIN